MAVFCFLGVFKLGGGAKNVGVCPYDMHVRADRPTTARRPACSINNQGAGLAAKKAKKKYKKCGTRPEKAAACVTAEADAPGREQPAPIEDVGHARGSGRLGGRIGHGF